VMRSNLIILIYKKKIINTFYNIM